VRAAVAESFVGFTRDLEGATTFMYLDVLGLVTSGYGNLLDPIGAALSLPWRRPDGELATRDEVVAAWSAVKALKNERDPQGRLWTQRGGGVFAQFTSIRLDAGGVDRLVRAAMASNDAALARRYTDWESWPACAQLACMSLAWACGAHYDYPKMDGHLRDGDFMAASQEIEMPPEHNPGNNLKARNEANAILMMNAARVRDYHLAPDLIDWTALIGVHDLPTISEVPNPASEPTVIVHIDPSTYLRPDNEPPDSAA
jgi:GH24 family phage-related lysozyme (muramidase)